MTVNVRASFTVWKPKKELTENEVDLGFWLLIFELNIRISQSPIQNYSLEITISAIIFSLEEAQFLRRDTYVPNDVSSLISTLKYCLLL